MHRILIIDGETDRRERMVFLLQHMGYSVDTCRDGNCLEAGSEPDVVLVSEPESGAGGRETAVGVINRFGGLKIVLGSETEEVAGVPYLEKGADVYVPAPTDMRLLLARVRALVNRVDHWEEGK